MNWKVYKLEEIAEIYGGGTPSTKDSKNFGKEYSWITPKDLSSCTSKFIGSGERSLSSQGFKTQSSRMTPKNSIILTTRAPVGLIAINTLETTTNQGCHSIVPDRNLVDLDFLYYLLKFNTKYLNQISGGTTFKELSRESLKSLKFAIPDLVEQRKLALRLNLLDEMIDIQRLIVSKSEQALDMVYQFYFKQYGTSSGDIGSKMMVEIDSASVPELWNIKLLKDLANITTGKKDANFADSDGVYSFFTCGEEVLSCTDFAFEGKAVLVAGNGNFNVKIFDGKFNAYQRTYVVLPNNNKYFGLVYKAISEQIETLSMGSRGSIVKFITMGDLADIRIAFSKGNENNEALELMNSYADAILNAKNKISKLTNLIKFIGPITVSGQLA